MNFIINGLVRYKPLDGTLYLFDNSIDMITLPRFANEILFFFIKNNGIALSREAILNEIWEKKGISSSGNNLNNYISLLRKSLALCHCHTVITTIPKYGFLFETEIETEIEIEIETETETETETDFIQNFNRAPVIQHAIKEESESPVRSKIKKNTLFILNFLIIGVIITLVAFHTEVYRYFLMDTMRTKIFSINQCEFYFLDKKMKEKERNDAVENIKSIIKNENIDCNNKIKGYYFVEDRIDSLGKSIINYAVSFCETRSQAPCRNHKTYKNRE